MPSRVPPRLHFPICEQVRHLVAQGRLAEAIALFLEKPETDAPELLDRATLLSGQLGRLTTEERLNTITRDTAEVERQRISRSLLELLQEVQRYAEPPPEATPLSARERQARTRYLKAFRRTIENLLRESIHNARLLDLGVRDTRAATYVPWMYQSTDARPFNRIEEAFEAYERRLLVLGAPGAGKTTTLQHIALQLVAEAEQDETAPIPVLVNLSKFRMDVSKPLRRGWMPWSSSSRNAAPQRAFEEWLAGELAANPDARVFASKWIQEKRIAALLDGLDEVSDERRAELVRLLNATFLADNPSAAVVVCSRIDEYEPLRGHEQTRLQLLGAVSLTPLSADQVRDYLAVARADGLAQALEKDSSLMEMARTPLTLSMMTLAYAELPGAEIEADLSLTDRWHHLMEAYVSRMLQRNERRERNIPFDADAGRGVRPSEYRYHPDRVNKYLGWLAVRLSVRMQTSCSFGQFYSFLSRPPGEGQRSTDLWTTSLTLALFVAMTHALIALPLVPDVRSVPLAAAIIAGGAVLLTLRGTRVLTWFELPRPIWITGFGMLIVAGVTAVAVVARALSTLVGERISPLAMGLSVVSAIATIIGGIAACDSDREERKSGQMILVATAASLTGALALSPWLPSYRRAGLLPAVSVLGAQAITIMRVLLHDAGWKKKFMQLYDMLLKRVLVVALHMITIFNL